MSFWIPLIVFVLSPLGFFALFAFRFGGKKPLLSERHEYLGGLITVVLMGIAAGFLGFDLIQSQSQLVGMIGGFILISGIQVALWAVGIRLDFFGNQSTVDESQSRAHNELGLALIRIENSNRISELHNEVFRVFEEFIPDFDYEFASKLKRVIENPELQQQFAPLLKQILFAAEELRLEASLHEAESGRRTRRALIRAVARLRAELITFSNK